MLNDMKDELKIMRDLDHRVLHLSLSQVERLVDEIESLQATCTDLINIAAEKTIKLKSLQERVAELEDLGQQAANRADDAERQNKHLTAMLDRLGSEKAINPPFTNDGQELDDRIEYANNRSESE
jgi:uncharacterized protein (DUF3084 family)